MRFRKHKTKFKIFKTIGFYSQIEYFYQWEGKKLGPKSID